MKDGHIKLKPILILFNNSVNHSLKGFMFLKRDFPENELSIK